MLTFLRIIVLGLLILPVSAAFACEVVWKPSSAALANGGWFSGNVYVGGQERVSYDAVSDSVEITQRQGVEKQLAEHRPLAPFVRGDVARLSVEMYVAPDFIPNKMSRLAIGLRGGAVAKTRKISGGATVDVQDGWSFRINHDNKFRLYAYAYNLNRKTRFGGGPILKTPFPKGQWMTIALDVTLNTPGQADGNAVLTLMDETGSVRDSLTMRNLVWRNSADWDSFGIILTDLIKLPPSQEQSILYRNFELKVGDGPECLKGS